MRYIKKFENYGQETNLLIVDVQKSFRKFFTELYLYKLNKLAESYTNVYQIFDNHVDGKNVDKDYLYDENPDLPVNGDLYEFPNQKELVEKRYNYDVDADFYKKILDDKTYKVIKYKESKGLLTKGEMYNTTEGTIIIYIGNNHNWIHLGKRLIRLLQSLSGKQVTIVGGSDNECLEDIFVAAESLGVLIKRDHRYIYSAVYCPIK